MTALNVSIHGTATRMRRRTKSGYTQFNYRTLAGDEGFFRVPTCRISEKTRHDLDRLEKGRGELPVRVDYQGARLVSAEIGETTIVTAPELIRSQMNLG